MSQAFLKQSLTCSIGVGPIKPREVLAMIRDLLTDGMNPIEDIEVRKCREIAPPGSSRFHPSQITAHSPSTLYSGYSWYFRWEERR